MKSLTDREILVVACLIDGITDKDIAARTGVSKYTLQRVMKSIYAKLGVVNRTQAAVWAWKHGIRADSIKCNGHKHRPRGN